jgi:predicted RNA-binding protein
MKKPILGIFSALMILTMLSLSVTAVGPFPRVRVLHASPDAPSVDVWVNGNLALEDVMYGEITDFTELPRGMYNVQVVPSGATEPVVIDADLDLWRFRDYTVVASGFLSGITPQVIANGRYVPRRMASVRFSHMSPDAPAVDIYANGAMVFEDVMFGETEDFVYVSPNEYDFEVKVAGTDTVALEVPGVELERGSSYTVFALGTLADNTLEAKLVEDMTLRSWTGRGRVRGNRLGGDDEYCEVGEKKSMMDDDDMDDDDDDE